jgi:hypothetical protein
LKKPAGTGVANEDALESLQTGNTFPRVVVRDLGLALQGNPRSGIRHNLQ